MPRPNYHEEREYAWNYFSIHAEQRLKTFNFYVLFSSLISGAAFSVAKVLHSSLYIWPMAFMISFLSFIFWRLDRRNKELIGIGESSLKKIEEKIKELSAGDVYASPISDEEGLIKRKDGRIHTYSDCFNFVFIVFGYGGLIIGVFNIIKDISLMK